MRLFIAEKPSAATSLATELGNPKKANGYIQCGEDYVTWCFGHLFESPKPEHYNPALAQWKMADLPIVPEQWEILPKADAKAQLKIIGSLLSKADIAVNAGDPDNEGQLLVDDVLEHFKFEKPTKRFWVSAQDPVSIRRGLDSLKENSQYTGFRDSAKARGHADWLIGYNLSRAYTLVYQGKGEKGFVTVGRVQTPTLQIVADRDNEISNFKSVNFYSITALVVHENGKLKMKWQPAEDQAGLDSESRLLNKEIADQLISEIKGKSGVISEYTKEPKNQGQPKGLSLTGITVLASNAFGYSAKEVLETCQSLYETHKVTSYPRSDCEFLPETQHGAAADILNAITKNIPSTSAWVEKADSSIKSKIWNDAKVTAHHAIIPTAHECDPSKLTLMEKNIYQLISRAYIAQFYPLHQYLQTAVTAIVEGQEFKASGKTVIVNGWKDLYTSIKNEDGGEENEEIPLVKEMDAVNFSEVTREDKKTKPPQHFTEGTLLLAMENVYKFTDNPEDKKALKDGDGIGTPATRSGIINKHKERGNLAEDGKYIKCTTQGFKTLEILPSNLKSPALTAIYERQLKEIVQGKFTLHEFEAEQISYISNEVATVRPNVACEISVSCPVCQSGELRKINGTKGVFWGCSEYRAGCKATFPDMDGKPDITVKKAVASSENAIECPDCKKGKMRRVAKKDNTNFFWSCSEWRAGCKCTLSDKDGSPVLKKIESVQFKFYPDGIR